MAPDPEIPVCPDAANEKPSGLRGDQGRDEPPDSLQSEEGIPRWAFELGGGVGLIFRARRVREHLPTRSFRGSRHD